METDIVLLVISCELEVVEMDKVYVDVSWSVSDYN